ncbi:hypothetical protein [Nocardioides okcheonensis]|uniref:hypothetical protein n=1 Tax=Nocardioides okcheonensis TaxID=2894081 RepID=UPI001E597875|nr:hypothetical protein [Nocardioides okcheonensis]UFN44505.1 hypothetical protein LN652_21090 [Nocardioides okcheonensis]
MEDAERVARQLVELLTEPFLADRAGVPRLRRLRFVRDGEDQAAQLRVLLADARLACGLAALVLAAGGSAGGAGVDGVGVS